MSRNIADDAYFSSGLKWAAGQCGQCLEYTAPHLLHGNLMRNLGIARHEIGHGFGLTEVEFFVQEGPERKFTWLGCPGTCIHKKL